MDRPAGPGRGRRAGRLVTSNCRARGYNRRNRHFSSCVKCCRNTVPEAELHCGPAERLPFADRQFDFISCLGALEHFLDIEGSLQEMIRVAKTNASILLLVPNADFLPSRLGLYNGTLQAAMKEQALSLLEWEQLFESAGLRVKARWKDLHIISTEWIFRPPFYEWPLRAAQAAVLPFWPLNCNTSSTISAFLTSNSDCMNILVITGNFPPRRGGMEQLLGNRCDDSERIIRCSSSPHMRIIRVRLRRESSVRAGGAWWGFCLCALERREASSLSPGQSSSLRRQCLGDR